MSRSRADRRWVWVALAGFLLVAVGVIWRRSLGIEGARRLQELTRQRDALHDERLRLDAAIRAATSRERLIPLAQQRLGLRLPDATQVIPLTRPSRTP